MSNYNFHTYFNLIKKENKTIEDRILIAKLEEIYYNKEGVTKK